MKAKTNAQYIQEIMDKDLSGTIVFEILKKWHKEELDF